MNIFETYQTLISAVIGALLTTLVTAVIFAFKNKRAKEQDKYYRRLNIYKKLLGNIM